jgi:hypothetical protein
MQKTVLVFVVVKFRELRRQDYKEWEKEENKGFWTFLSEVQLLGERDNASRMKRLHFRIHHILRVPEFFECLCKAC